MECGSVAEVTFLMESVMEVDEEVVIMVVVAEVLVREQ